MNALLALGHGRNHGHITEWDDNLHGFIGKVLKCKILCIFSQALEMEEVLHGT